ncbi:hypothetical protein [Microbacterium sp. NPDC056234]|uniref:hypothetical protein n=1 Tax=Microbacterium sp. NPDC056234 TaxID=3345757 RepID=UPI0035D8BA9C
MGVVLMRRLRRGRSLGALLLAVVAVVAVHVWFDVLPSNTSASVTAVSADDAVDVAGQQLLLRSVREDEFDAPEGAHALSVRLRSSGGLDATTCPAFLLTEAAGGRVWESSRAELDVPHDAGESGCRAESAPYDILAVFVVPDDATGPFWFDVTDEDGTVLRLPVEP